jgi:cell division protein FtsL
MSDKLKINKNWLAQKIEQGATSRDCARSSGYSKSHILKIAKENGLKFNNKNPFKK